jgi:hypothetical protein
MLAQTDPTDHALATIASILEHSEPRREADKAPTEKASLASASTETTKVARDKAAADKPAAAKTATDKAATDKTAKDKAATEKIEPSPPLVPPDADGYSKVSPGPIAAIRFKWTVRRADNGEYFVDEIVGEHSGRATSGPMAKEAAVKLVDDREAEARLRFEQLRGEMTGRVAAAEFVRGEA